MIVTHAWHRCRLREDGAESAEPRRCFFVGAASEEIKPLLRLCPQVQREFFVELNRDRRQDRDAYFSAAKGDPRWWFLVADDLSRALLCSATLVRDFLGDHRHVEALSAEVWAPEQLRGLATYRPRDAVFCDEPGCATPTDQPEEEGPEGMRVARCAPHRGGATA